MIDAAVAYPWEIIIIGPRTQWGNRNQYDREEFIVPAILPPEIGKTLEGLFKKGVASEGGDWIKEYVDFSEHEAHGIPVQRMNIKDEDMAGLLGKPVGRYSTLLTGPLGDYDDLENVCACLTEELDRYLSPCKGKTLLVCGIGNPDSLVDSIGPETAKRILTHAPMKSAFEKLTVLIPSVSGITNISGNTLIASVSSATDAACVLLVDSINCTEHSRFCRSIQLTDAGIQLYHNGEEISHSTIGVPVISIGVPTVISVKNLAPDIEVSDQELLTAFNIEAVVRRASLMIACAIMRVAYPELDHSASMMIAEYSLL